MGGRMVGLSAGQFTLRVCACGRIAIVCSTIDRSSLVHVSPRCLLQFMHDTRRLANSKMRSGRSLTGMMWSTLRRSVLPQFSQNGLSLRSRLDRRSHRAVCSAGCDLLPLRTGRHCGQYEPLSITSPHPMQGRFTLASLYRLIATLACVPAGVKVNAYGFGVPPS